MVGGGGKAEREILKTENREIYKLEISEENKFTQRHPE
jgi:hypothetical protein